MEIYTKQDFIKELEQYIQSLFEYNSKWGGKDEQVVNSSLEGFLKYLQEKEERKNN